MAREVWPTGEQFDDPDSAWAGSDPAKWPTTDPRTTSFFTQEGNSYALVRRSPHDPTKWGHAITMELEYKPRRSIAITAERGEPEPNPWGDDDEDEPDEPDEPETMYRIDEDGRHYDTVEDPGWEFAGDDLIERAWRNMSGVDPGDYGEAVDPGGNMVETLYSTESQAPRALTMLQIAENRTGESIFPSSSLSPHSSNLVRGLQELGLVDKSASTQRTNDITYPKSRYEIHERDLRDWYPRQVRVPEAESNAAFRQVTKRIVEARQSHRDRQARDRLRREQRAAGGP